MNIKNLLLLWIRMTEVTKRPSIDVCLSIFFPLPNISNCQLMCTLKFDHQQKYQSRQCGKARRYFFDGAYSSIFFKYSFNFTSYITCNEYGLPVASSIILNILRRGGFVEVCESNNLLKLSQLEELLLTKSNH